MKLFRIVVIYCLSSIFVINTYASDTLLLDDYTQTQSSSFEGISHRQANINYFKCMQTASNDPCWEDRCTVKFCKERHRRVDVDGGACTNDIQIVKNCRQRQLAEEKDAREETKRLARCKDLSNEFKMFFLLKNMRKCEDLIQQGYVSYCDWALPAKKAVCEIDQKQFEAAFDSKNMELCSQILSRSTKCFLWFRDAELRVQKVTTSTLVEGPPKSLSECLSLETSFNDTYKKDEKIACAIWLDDSVGCSWHKEAVRRCGNKALPTIGPDLLPQHNSDYIPAPFITGFSESDAQSILGNIGLGLYPVEGDRATTREQVGTVHKQEPLKGTPLEPGVKVKAWIYVIVVPDVIGKKVENAEKELQRAWFKTSTVDGSVVKSEKKWNKVELQSKAGGDKVKEIDTEVILTLYKKPAQKTPPYTELLGHWKGTYARSSRQSTLPPYNIEIDITSIGLTGRFKGVYTMIWFAKERNERSLPIRGRVEGNNVFFTGNMDSSRKIMSGWSGAWNNSNETIQGSHQVFSKSENKMRNDNRHFFLKKK